MAAGVSVKSSSDAVVFFLKGDGTAGLLAALPLVAITTRFVQIHVDAYIFTLFDADASREYQPKSPKSY